MFKFRNILLVVIIVAAYFTNPNEQTFKTEIEAQLIKEMKSAEGQFIVGEVLSSKFLETLLWAFVSTDYQDYKLCSTFELKAGDKKMKFFGIFGQVIPISGSGAISELKAN